MTGGRREVGAILARLLRFRFKFRWWLLAMLLMPATYGAAALVTSGKQLHLLLNPSSWWFLPLSFAYLVVVTAGEEIGWRGYALPLLLETRMPPTVAATVLGVLWGVWHIPLRIPSGLSAFSLPLFIVFTASLSVVYLVLLQRSGGSLIPALLLHASTDLAPRVMDISKLDSRFWLAAVIVLLTVAVLLCIIVSQPNGRRNTASSVSNFRQPQSSQST
jgi:membrane protease YdiL (CAAX protease family)